ncbi:MAG: hypothetical protein HQM08_29235 [Candidatus Riflebacteria bacterium]|nr:hypothetical protein [Candidatus Riflebacteria bacterium]
MKCCNGVVIIWGVIAVEQQKVRWTIYVCGSRYVSNATAWGLLPFKGKKCYDTAIQF